MNISNESTILIGTEKGIYREKIDAIDEAEKVLDSKHVLRVRRFGDNLYVAARSAPPAWGGKRGADAVLFESTDGGDTFRPVAYPGQPEDFFLAWTAAEKEETQVFAGTRGDHILCKTESEWIRIGRCFQPFDH